MIPKNYSKDLCCIFSIYIIILMWYSILISGMGDLKTLTHNSYSLDRRGLGTPLSTRNYHYPDQNDNNKYNSLTKLHNTKNVQLNNKNSFIVINNNPYLSTSLGSTMISMGPF